MPAELARLDVLTAAATQLDTDIPTVARKVAARDVQAVGVAGDP